MESVFYQFLRKVRLNYFLMNTNKRNFVLYALGLSSIRGKEIRCRVPLKDGFYFLCNGEENIERLSEEIDNIFKAFQVVLKTERSVRHLSLLNKSSFDTAKVVLVFNLNYVESWLEFEKIEELRNEDIAAYLPDNEGSMNSCELDDFEEFPDDYKLAQKANHLTVTIEELPLSVRVFNWLKRAGFETVEDLIEKTEAELKRFRPGNPLGEKGIKEIRDQLHYIGLDFKKDDNIPS